MCTVQGKVLVHVAVHAWNAGYAVSAVRTVQSVRCSATQHTIVQHITAHCGAV